ETVFEAQATGFGEGRVVNFTEGLSGREIREWYVSVFGFGIHEAGMALVEGTALRVLPAKAKRRALKQERTERQGFRESVIDGTFSMAHFRPLFEQLHDFGMDVETLRNANQRVSQLPDIFRGQSGFHFVFRTKFSPMVRRPIIRQFAKIGSLLELAGFGFFDFVFRANCSNGSCGVNPSTFGVDFPKRRMGFDTFIKTRLG